MFNCCIFIHKDIIFFIPRQVLIMQMTMQPPVWCKIHNLATKSWNLWSKVLMIQDILENKRKFRITINFRLCLYDLLIWIINIVLVYVVSWISIFYTVVLDFISLSGSIIACVCGWCQLIKLVILWNVNILSVVYGRKLK